ncbi:hypothetical protein ERX35_010225 [Macrococcus equipercicus]|uniref:Nuclear transport factor 2 family protein n=1 Tax=Macrococcus equipercicus TaxID=69967 RepID=A0ABQ6R6H4_9STAP|nr:nuclear transport factor 2 family protein [Macrococcus equipercicus]KAA1036898.1 hypothetical protein ERX35_010225 [Macrococcus equipercicus]
MSHFNFLLACQNRDFDALEEMSSERMVFRLVRQDSTEQTGSLKEMKEVFANAFQDLSYWDFEVVHKVQRNDHNIVIIDSRRENRVDGTVIHSLWILTFQMHDGKEEIQKVHIEWL